MTPFKASNGRVIKPLDWDSEAIEIFRSDGRNSLSAYDHLDVYDMQALREFFAQERNEDLPFRHHDYWVFPQGKSNNGSRKVVVVRPGESFVVYREDRLPGYVEGLQPSGYLAAAKAYFAAHPKPEPKPWLDAQTGEVWSISDDYAGGLAICRLEVQDDGDYHPYFYGPNFDGIRGDALTAGTRLEVQS